MAGGYAIPGGDQSASVDRYDPSTNVWAAVAPMTKARSNAGAAVLGGRLYVTGGDTGRVFSVVEDSVERYDPSTNSWEQVAPMKIGRRRHAFVELEGKLYAIGGFDGTGGRSRFTTSRLYDSLPP